MQEDQVDYRDQWTDFFIEEEFEEDIPLNLYLAARRAILDEVEKILADHPNLSYQPEILVQSAASSGSMEMLHYVLRIHPEAVTNKSLESAASSGSVRMLDYLLDHYPDLEVDSTTLDKALESGSLELVDYLHHHYPDLRLTQSGLVSAITSGSVELVKYALATWTDPWVDSPVETYRLLGLTAIIEADSVEMLDYVLTRYSDSIGDYLLREAVKDREPGDLELVEYLLTHHPELQPDLRTLKFVIKSGSLQWTEHILKRTNLPVNRILLYYAINSGSKDLVEYLIDNYPDLKEAFDNRRWLSQVLWLADVSMIIFLFQLVGYYDPSQYVDQNRTDQIMNQLRKSRAKPPRR